MILQYFIVAVDFDGTMTKYPGIVKDTLDLEDYRACMVQLVKNMKKIGIKVILWTCRTKKHLETAVTRTKEIHNIEFDKVNANLDEVIYGYGDDPRKIFADYYIDDKANLLETSLLVLKILELLRAKGIVLSDEDYMILFENMKCQICNKVCEGY